MKMIAAILAVGVSLVPVANVHAQGSKHSFSVRAESIGGAVSMTGGGVYDPLSGFLHGGGEFRCSNDITSGPLAGLRAGEGIRWEAVDVLASSGFKCVSSDVARTAVTDDDTVVFEARFYRDGTSVPLTAKVFVSAEDENPDLQGTQNVWIQQVGCAEASVNLH